MCERKADHTLSNSDQVQQQVNGYRENRHKGFTLADGGRQEAEASLRHFRATGQILAPGSARGSSQIGSENGAQAEQPGTAIVNGTVLPATPTPSHAKRQPSQPAETARPVKAQRTSGHFEQYQTQDDIEASRDEPLRVNVSGWSTYKGRVHDYHEPANYANPSSIHAIENPKVDQDIIVLDDSENDADGADLSKVETAGNDYIAFDESPNGLEALHNAHDETSAKVDSIIYEKTVPPLCREQIDLVNLILGGKNVFYTGSAGCGKSTVLRCFQKCLRILSKRVHIVAPTGQAALDIGGSTVRMLGV